MPAKLIILNANVQLNLHLRPDSQHVTFLTVAQCWGKKNTTHTHTQSFSQYAKDDCYITHS